ncbi:MAG: ribonuclease HII [Chlorobiaceae bacterium]|nr:ribonuclease HII [Chlorobiaceae bacterium]
MMNTSYEWPLWQTSEFVCGIDEAGRGPLAGPVVAAAVVFPRWFSPEESILEKLNDSKKLSARVREELAPAIKAAALFWAVTEIDPEIIDRINIFQATMLAMNRSVETLGMLPHLLLVDGNRFRPHLPIPYEAIVKGDAKVFSIAAASVLAKTRRDEIMTACSRSWPEYGFDRHFGYATAEHVRAIRQYGRCPLHRVSFRLKELGEK